MAVWGSGKIILCPRKPRRITHSLGFGKILIEGMASESHSYGEMFPTIRIHKLGYWAVVA